MPRHRSAHDCNADNPIPISGTKAEFVPRRFTVMPVHNNDKCIRLFKT